MRALQWLLSSKQKHFHSTQNVDNIEVNIRYLRFITDLHVYFQIFKIALYDHDKNVPPFKKTTKISLTHIFIFSEMDPYCFDPYLRIFKNGTILH